MRLNSAAQTKQRRCKVIADNMIAVLVHIEMDHKLDKREIDVVGNVIDIIKSVGSLCHDVEISDKDAHYTIEEIRESFN